MLDELVWTLERAFERSGVFFIGVLETGERHEKAVQALAQRLATRGIDVAPCCLDTASVRPFEAFDLAFRQAQAQQRRVVLALWSLEHLSPPQLQRTLRWLNAGRERLSQQPAAGQVSVPVVLLVDRVLYGQCFARWAGDLLDALPPPFELF